jgi:hypothetical protein
MDKNLEESRRCLFQGRVLFDNFPRRTWENYDNIQSALPVSAPRFETDISKI